MPLNIQENEEQSFQEKPQAEPILHTPSEHGHLTSKIVGILFGILVLAAMGFLLYSYGVLGGGNRSGTAASENHEILDQSAQQNHEPALSQAGSTPASSPGTQGGGRYTVYIASYRTRLDAEEEVSRWKDAGYEASVHEHEGWFRVALGQYEQVAAAKSSAEGLKECFEQGYWIGPI